MVASLDGCGPERNSDRGRIDCRRPLIEVMPTDLSDFGKILIGIGIVIVLMGAVLVLAGRLPGVFGPIGKLPGDILFKRASFTFYFPITTSILASIILSLLAWLLFRK